MSRPEIVPIPNGALEQNCYLVGDPARRVCVLVDPGEEVDRFFEVIRQRGWTLKAVWLTHAHVDHVMGVEAVRRRARVPVYLHPADRPLYDALPQQGQWLGVAVAKPAPPEHELAHGQVLAVGDCEFTVRHVPGHSPGHVAFVAPGVVLGGDVLFSGSIGRSDLPGGDGDTLMRSIAREFLTLPDDTVVYSGHGPETTIGAERRTNPFLQQL